MEDVFQGINSFVASLYARTQVSQYSTGAACSF